MKYLILILVVIIGCESPIVKNDETDSINTISVLFVDGHTEYYNYEHLNYTTSRGHILAIDQQAYINIYDVKNFIANGTGHIDIYIESIGLQTYPYEQLIYNDRTVLSIINPSESYYYGSGVVINYYTY